MKALLFAVEGPHIKRFSNFIEPQNKHNIDKNTFAFKTISIR